MQLWQYCLLVTAKLLYMFRTLLRPSSGVLTAVEAATGACHASTHGMQQWLLLQLLVLLMMDAEASETCRVIFAVTNKQYCQSCIKLVLYIIQSYDARKLKHKIMYVSTRRTHVGNNILILKVLVTPNRIEGQSDCLGKDSPLCNLQYSEWAPDPFRML